MAAKLQHMSIRDGQTDNVVPDRSMTQVNQPAEEEKKEIVATIILQKLTKQLSDCRKIRATTTLVQKEQQKT